MTYYTKDQFAEKYYIEFVDLKGGKWHVGIEVPDFEGTAIQMTGSENPLEWMGNGDDDQTECVLGSTGTLRIMCHNTNDETYLADIRPTEINNRRVTVTRDDEFVWQGFLKKEEYNQDWIAMPYEIELPIQSPLALAEDFYLPPYSDVTKNQRYWRLLVAYMVTLMGIDITYLISNLQAHINLRGARHGTYWIEGVCNIEHFYDFSENNIAPKTVKDVLEAMLYPYGHLREMGHYWVVTTADVKKGNTLLYWKNMDEVEEGMVLPTEEWMQTGYETIALTDIDLADTDNQVTLIDAPSEVNFETGVDENSTILSLGNDQIKSSFCPTYSNMTVTIDTDDNKKTYYVVGVGTSYIENNVCTMSGGSWVRVMQKDLTYKDDESSTVAGARRASYSFPVELGVLVKSKKMTITPNQHLRTEANRNSIKLTIKVYNHLGKAVEDDLSDLQYSNGSGYSNIGDAMWKNGNEYTLIIGNNTTNHRTGAVNVMLQTTNTNGYIVSVKMEYIKTQEDTNDAATNSMSQDIFNHKMKNTIGGNGDAINIKFKSLCADDPGARSNVCVPYNGFCDSAVAGSTGEKYIDTKNRKKLELAAVRTTDPLYFLKTIAYITDNGTNYWPVAVGMNARDCTTQLRLISTNL